MTTLELLQLQNEHKEDNFFGKGEDATEEQEGDKHAITVDWLH